MGEPLTDRLQCFDGHSEDAFLLSPFVDEYLKHAAGASVSPLALRKAVAMAMRLAHAAGYARAERDVVAMHRKMAASAEKAAVSFGECKHAVNRAEQDHYKSKGYAHADAIRMIEQGAHRGAAGKDGE